MSDTYTVVFESDPRIAAYLTYSTALNTMSYDGKKITGLMSNQFINSKITLVNTAGENLYSQSIVIYLPQEQSPLSTQDEAAPEEDSASEENSEDTATPPEITEPDELAELDEVEEPADEPAKTWPPPSMSLNQTTENYVESLQAFMDFAIVKAAARAGFTP